MYAAMRAVPLNISNGLPTRRHPKLQIHGLLAPLANIGCLFLQCDARAINVQYTILACLKEFGSPCRLEASLHIAIILGAVCVPAFE